MCVWEVGEWDGIGMIWGIYIGRDDISSADGGGSGAHLFISFFIAFGNFFAQRGGGRGRIIKYNFWLYLAIIQQ